MSQKNRSRTRYFTRGPGGEWQELKPSPYIPGLEDFELTITTFSPENKDHDHDWIEDTVLGDLRRTFTCSCGARKSQPHEPLAIDLPSDVQSFLEKL